MRLCNPTKILNISILKDTDVKINQQSKKLSYNGKNAYVKKLLINGLNYCKEEDMYIYLKESSSMEKLTEEYITIRVPENVYERLKKISLSARVSLPRIAGHFVEKGYEKEEHTI